MVGPGIGRDFLSGEIFGNRNRWQITDTAELPQGIGIGAVTTVMVGWLIGILIMVYYNPYIYYITGEFPIPYIIQPTRVFFRGSWYNSAMKSLFLPYIFHICNDLK